jgi:hypothetical protein
LPTNKGWLIFEQYRLDGKRENEVVSRSCCAHDASEIGIFNLPIDCGRAEGLSVVE